MQIAALWLQETDTLSAGNTKWLMIFVGLVAFAMVVQAAVSVGIAIKGAAAMKELMVTVEELKTKALPLIASATAASQATESLLRENAPKVRAIAQKVDAISDNMMETSYAVRDSALRFDRTIADLNQRTQRQVARVDSMVSATLSATADMVETINQGIRTPAHKLAAMATQARTTVETLIGKARSVVNGSSPRK